jgi:hypothetical protein
MYALSAYLAITGTAQRLLRDERGLSGVVVAPKRMASRVVGANHGTSGNDSVRRLQYLRVRHFRGRSGKAAAAVQMREGETMNYCTGKKEERICYSSSRIKRFIDDKNGDATVEAAIVFPIMIMIFAALVLLAVYLPARGALQRATQYAATALATERSDTWLFYDKDTMSFYWEDNKRNLKNVYVELFSGGGDIQEKGEAIVIEIEGRSLSSKAGNLDVICYLVNRFVYKEVVVTATREFNVPIDLSFIRFPETIPVTVTSMAVVQNGDEFIRNIDIAVDFIEFTSEKLNISKATDVVGSFWDKARTFLGW